MLQIEKFDFSGNLFWGNAILVCKYLINQYKIQRSIQDTKIYIRNHFLYIFLLSLSRCEVMTMTFSVYLVFGEFVMKQIPPITATRYYFNINHILL